MSEDQLHEQIRCLKILLKESNRECSEFLKKNVQLEHELQQVNSYLQKEREFKHYLQFMFEMISKKRQFLHDNQVEPRGILDGSILNKTVLVKFYKEAKEIIFDLNLGYGFGSFLFDLNKKKEKMIEKYQLGTKSRKASSEKKWNIAREYFIEEIPKHSTLKTARMAACTRAGIFVEKRQMISKLPNPIKKIV